MIGSVVVPVAVILVLVLINGVFVAAEFALVGSRRSRLQTLADSGSGSARWLLGVFDRTAGKDGYIAVAQLGITLASIGLGMYGEPAVAHWLYDPFESAGLSEDAAHTVGFVVALSAITFLHVVLGEMVPKALALQAPEAVSLRVNPVMRLFSLIFRPVVAVLNATAFALMRMLRIPEPDQRLSLYTSEELAIVTDEAAHSGQLGDLQRDLIHNIFELDQRSAAELMTSRSRTETLALDASPEQVMARIAASPRSRYPVVDGGLDQVVGVLHIKDFIRAQEQGRTAALETLMRPLPTVAATTSAEQLLEQFKKHRLHASLVVDEFGGTLGFVTLDDIIADVMNDNPEHHSDDALAVTNLDGSVSLDGETTLAELREDHGLCFDNPEVTTLAGLFLAGHGTVPGVGSTATVQGHELTVEEMEGHKIVRIRVRAGTSHATS